MVKQNHELTRRSQGKAAVRKFWTQAGRRIWRRGGETGTRKRESHHLPEQRSGAGHPYTFHQGVACGSGTAQQTGRVHGQESLVQLAALFCLLAVLAGCAAHHEPPPAMPAPPPPPSASIPPARIPTPTPTPAPVHPATPAPKTNTEITVPKNARVLYTEVGYASWYGPGFQKRNAANGQPYDMDAMTAAHRTLPLSTIARVTDVKTGDSVLVRITDRGPFVGDRVIDLSRAAARRLSVFQKGVALVRIEVLETPAPIKEGGRWCVQIGAFADANDATQLKEKLSRRYRTAKVLQFTSPVGGDWLRIRVADDDKQRAQEVMRDTHTDAGVYLVRLD